ncbi:MAG: serine O-acetyltransferase [Agriterribacter sp.]
MSGLTFLFQDWPHNKGNTKGRIVAVAFRLANICSKHNFLKLILFPHLIFYKFFFEWILGIEIPKEVSIGKGLKVYHLQAIVINKKVRIGENCQLRQSTTIGNKGPGTGCPVIGNNVNIGANVCIIGDIVIGNNVNIGAGSVVVKNVPDNCTVAGNPARIIKQING